MTITTTTRVADIGVLAKIASKYPQSAYHGFATSLQAEWQYLCRTTPGVGAHMGPVEDAIRNVMIPAILQLKPSEVTDDLRTLLSHGVKQGGINFRNPVEDADAVFASSEAASGTSVASLLDGTVLEPVTHRGQVRAASVAARKEKVTKEKAALELLKVNAPKKVIKRLKRIGQCGIWLSIPPNKLGGS